MCLSQKIIFNYYTIFILHSLFWKAIVFILEGPLKQRGNDNIPTPNVFTMSIRCLVGVLGAHLH